MTTLSHRIALDPTPAQRTALAKAAGCARVAYNWSLAEWKRQYAAGEKPSGPKLRIAWNAAKHGLFPWMKESPKDANIEAVYDLENAFKKFFKKQAKYPRFKKKGKDAPSFGVSNDKFRCEARKVRLPVIGWVKTREALRFDGKVQAGRVTYTTGRWFLSVAVEADHLRPPAPADTLVGIDLGVKALATLSDGTVYENPKALQGAAKRLRRAELSIARKKRARDKKLGTAAKGEKRPIGKNLAKACKRAARVHAHVANVRNDAIHKATTAIAATYTTVVIEDLHVRGMTHRAKGRGRAAKSGLNRSILDAGFGEFRRQLQYKLPLHGGTLVMAPRFYPSSKMCSGCGVVKSVLSLSERTFRCDSCGCSIDRDRNAALNLHALGLRVSACGGDGSPVVVRPRRAVPSEAGRTRTSAHKRARSG